MNLLLPINKTGYGVTGQNILNSLYKRNKKISLWPIGGVECEKYVEEPLRESVKNSGEYDRNASCLRLYHMFDMALFAGQGKKFGFPIFELDRFSKRELHSAENVDEFIVCSDWAKEIMEQNFKKPVHVVPLGVNRDIFREKAAAETSETVFFNCGKWEVRKGHDFILKAFNKAFTKKDNVILVMNCFNPFIGIEGNMQWMSEYKSSPLGDKIHIIQERLETQDELCDIMNSVDCGLFPARAEGWNLELLEMLSCGKQVITTDYSAHKQFCNSKNSRLIPVKNKELAIDNVFFHGEGEWGELDNESMDAMVEHMREIHKLKQLKSLTLNFEGIKTAKKFSWDNTADLLIKIMERQLYGL